MSGNTEGETRKTSPRAGLQTTLVTSSDIISKDGTGNSASTLSPTTHQDTRPETGGGDKFLHVPGTQSRGGSLDAPLTPSSLGGDTLTASSSSNGAKPSREEGGDFLKPDLGSEAECQVNNNPFAFSPGQLAKLLNPKSHGACRALGGLTSQWKELAILRLPTLRCPFAAYRNRSRSGTDTGSDIKRQRQWEIPGLLQGIKVEAIPDYGSDLDIISEAFVQRNNWKIPILGRSSAPKIRLPTGGEVQSLGKIKLPFSFVGEPDVFERTFTVVKHCIHDIVLGNKFLKFTRTLSHHYHRLKERVLAKCSRTPRLCLLNSSSERIRGSINGSSTNAYPDTGSDVMVISKREATRLKLHIDTDEGSRTFLQFADGSYHYTDGMVYGAEWQFGYGGYGTGHSIRCDLHVLDQLSCDVILSNEFLFDNQVFANYQQCFYDMHMDKISGWPSHDDYNTAQFCLIKEKRFRGSVLESLKAFFSSPAERTSDPEAIAIDSDPVRQQDIAQYREICRQGNEEDRIAELPQQEQFAAMEAERLRRNEWLRTHNPIYSPPISSPSSPSAIPPSSCPSSSMNVHASSTEPANPPTGTWVLRTLRLIRPGR